MQKHYSNFPGGMPGIGLLILRASMGVATALYGGILIAYSERITTDQFSYFSNLVSGLLLVAGSIFLILGLLMPFVLTVLAATELVAVAVRLISADQIPGDKYSWILLFLLVSMTIAIFFVGPGAYSIDARLYGRRRIFIPSPKKPESESA